mmetsp:Transcript_65022/g.128450  ORF Transcript_65022/g.128450 Transcript_65022/m.128450 type:complete len:87 (-) Transcript_65022:119-379(-)
MLQNVDQGMPLYLAFWSQRLAKQQLPELTQLTFLLSVAFVHGDVSIKAADMSKAINEYSSKSILQTQSNDDDVNHKNCAHRRGDVL